MPPRYTLYALAVTLALCLLVWLWASDGAPEPMPAGAYIVPATMALLLVVAVWALIRTK